MATLRMYDVRDQAAAQTRKQMQEDRKRLPVQLVEFHKRLEARLFDPGLRMEELRRECGLRDDGFSSRFAGALGLTPWDYVTQCRLEIGARMLLESDLRVWQIGGSLGYGSGDAFGRAFRLRFKQTPSQYRRAAGKCRDESSAADLLSNEELESALAGELDREEVEALAARLAAIRSQLRSIYPHLGEPAMGFQPPASAVFVERVMAEQIVGAIGDLPFEEQRARLMSEIERSTPVLQPLEARFEDALRLAERGLIISRSAGELRLLDLTLEELAVAARPLSVRCRRLLLARLLTPDIEADPELVKTLRHSETWAEHYWWVNRVCLKLRNDNALAACEAWNDASDKVDRLLTHAPELHGRLVAELPEYHTRAVVLNFVDRIEEVRLNDLDEAHHLTDLAAAACRDGSLDECLYALIISHRGNLFRLQGETIQASRLSNEATRSIRNSECHRDLYIASRMLSIHVDILLESGFTKRLPETLAHLNNVAREIRDPEPAWRGRLQEGIFLEWQDLSAAGLYSDLIEEIQKEECAAPLVLSLARLNRVMSLAFHHNGEGAQEALATLAPFDNCSFELWRQYATALVCENMGELERARLLYKEIAAKFEEIDQGNNSAYVLLHYGLACLQLEDRKRGIPAIIVAARFFASSKVENGRAATAARAILEAKEITPAIVKALITAVRAPHARDSHASPT